MSRLERLGFDQEWRAVADPANERVGRVIRVDRGEVDVATETGDERAISDSLRSSAEVAPVTGDWVVLHDVDDETLVERILERRSALVRRRPGDDVRHQVLAVNVDVVAVVHGLDRPINEASMERFLALAIQSGAEPVVVFNKADLLRRPIDDLEWLDELAPTIVTSTTDGTGLDALRATVDGRRTIVLIGPSGAGKSSIINALAGSEMATGEVRAGDKRGRHTTTTRELFELPSGGALIDTPGIRAIGLWAADVALDQVFATITELAEHCRFRDCAHRAEPGCAVKEAVERGDVSPRRLARYHLLSAELEEQARALDQRSGRR